MSWALRHLTRQFLMFACVGAIGTAAQYLVLIASVEWLSIDAVIGSTLGFCLGALINYALNYRYTFVSTKSHREAMIKFFVVAGVGAVINSSIMYVGTTLLSFNYLLSQIAATGFVFFQNFVLNKIWTFSEA